MSGLSVYTNIVNYLSNDLNSHVFKIRLKKFKVKSLKNCEKVYVNQDRSVSVCTDTD